MGKYQATYIVNIYGNVFISNLFSNSIGSSFAEEVAGDIFDKMQRARSTEFLSIFLERKGDAFKLRKHFDNINFVYADSMKEVEGIAELILYTSSFYLFNKIKNSKSQEQ